MRIEEDLKLGFKDVLIRPKRSTLKSRSDVELEREFTFKQCESTTPVTLSYARIRPAQDCDFHFFYATIV